MSMSQSPAVESALGASARPRPHPARYALPVSALYMGVDIAVVFVAGIVAANVTARSLDGVLSNDASLQALAFAFVLWLLLFERIGMYRRSFSTNARDEVYAALAASTMAMAPSLAIFVLTPALHPYRNTLVLTVLLAATLVASSRAFLHAIRTSLLRPTARKIAVVGTGDRVRAVPQDLSLTASDEVYRFAVDDFDDELALATLDGDLSHLGWLRSALDRGCEEIIVTEALPGELMPALLRFTESHGVKLAFAPMRIRPHACDFAVRRDGGLALLYPRSLAICTTGARLIRRVFDLALAVPALVVLAPAMLAVALVVFLDSGAPIFYSQVRVGRQGRTFRILKFRTMRPDAEVGSGPVWARSGEDRTTRVGRILRRTSLDELPQLFNVVRGEMSIVGPRPERPYYVEQFRKMLPRYDERHLVKPGITGWSHVNMRRNVDTSAIGERLSYDLFYLENWSIFMDILIICKTGAEFLFHSAA